MRKAIPILTAVLATAVAATARAADMNSPSTYDSYDDYESDWKGDFKSIVGYGAGTAFVHPSLTLTYNDFAGATVEARYWNEKITLSQAFMFVQSDVGRVEGGLAFNMSRKLGITPPDVGPLSISGDYLFMRPGFLSSSGITTDTSSAKLNFMAEGAQDLVFAASYGPGNTNVRNRDVTADSNRFGQLYAAGAKYDMGEFGVSAGAVRFDNWDGGRARYEYAFGTKYYSKGFQLAAAWRHVPSDRADALNAGGAYEFGPLEASLTHLASRANGGWAHASMLSGKYTINETFAVSTSVGRESYVYRESPGRTGVIAAAGVSVAL